MALAPTSPEALARRALAIADPALRAAYVRHTLGQMETAAIAELLLIARSGAEARQVSHMTMLQALTLALADPTCSPLRDAVRDDLVGRGQGEAARALYARDAAATDDALRVPDFGIGRTPTLGERKSLARKRDRELISRVLRDPHPDVIRILLGNPALIETDVVVLCARRPVVSEVLREVFRSPRWVGRERVRIALVLNPYTPVDIALQLVPLLRRPELRRALSSTELAFEVRISVERALGRPTAPIH